jgi:hypothetical protein
VWLPWDKIVPTTCVSAVTPPPSRSLSPSLPLQAVDGCRLHQYRLLSGLACAPTLSATCILGRRNFTKLYPEPSLPGYLLQSTWQSAILPLR